MNKKIFLIIMIIFFCIGWTSNSKINTPVCTAGNDQKRPQLVSDGSGGAVIIWEDFRKGSDYDIYAQRMASSGIVNWEPDGVAICTAGGPQRYPQLAADSSEGFIITWYDRRNGKNNDIYSQRIDSSGEVLWTTDGIGICTIEGDQYDPGLVSDGQGGAIIVWYDRRNGKNYDIYAQRIDSSGSVKWVLNGAVICSAEGDQDNLRLISDGQGGAIITWQDRRNGSSYDIYAQRINSYGTVQWTANGIAVCEAEYDQRVPQIASGERGGAVITWQDKRNGSDYDIYAQQIDSIGKVQWAANGVPICTAENSQYDPRLVSVGNGGIVITWQDYRGGSQCDFNAFAQQTDLKSEVCEEKQLHDWNIYAQRIDSSGKIQWAANGVAICTAKVDQYKPQALSDGVGGTIITWQASDKENDHNIYAQRLNSSGTVRWPSDGVAVSTAGGSQLEPLLVSDDRGGAIITWYDKRKGNNCDIYAQRVCASGRISGCFIPVAVISADKLSGIASLKIDFKGRDSYDPDGFITRWKWNFGDGDTASTANVTHIYAAPGTYTVTLQVRDNTGEWSSFVKKEVKVYSKEG